MKKRNWTIGHISDCCNVIAGQSPKGSAYNDIGEGLEFHQGKKAFGQSLLQNSNVWTTEITKIAEPGDILMSVRAPVGPTNITDRKVCIGRGLAAIRCKKDVLSQFILYALRNIESKIVGNDGAVFNSINKNMIEELPVPIVSLAEQERIVEYLDRGFEKIDEVARNAEKSLEEAKAVFQGALKEMMEGKEGWREMKLKEISQYSIGLTYSPKNVCDDGTIVLRSSNIQDGKLDLNDIVRVNCPVKEELFVQEGDILMCSRNGSSRLVGKVAMIPNMEERMTYGTFMMIIRSEFNPFLYYFFNSDLFKNQIKKGEATMINQITRYMLDDVKLRIPSLSEQREIVGKLDALSERVKGLERCCKETVEECRAMKQAMLREVFE